ncbi:hypothetical protein MKW98_009929 [Papaver atlanticum]|uniref:Uncharacterized protein n=1 Tax=Papaver atlanticum TaxID=357466 RepID=A0AAD4XMX8_9MAGN|nr:hypothetical protein MKW98_009929 [Papaver atlanticum]
MVDDSICHFTLRLKKSGRLNVKVLFLLRILDEFLNKGKAPYISKEERKVEYNITMDAYNKKLDGGSNAGDISVPRPLRCNNATATRKFSFCTRPCQSSMRTASCWIWWFVEWTFHSYQRFLHAFVKYEIVELAEKAVSLFDMFILTCETSPLQTTLYKYDWDKFCRYQIFYMLTSLPELVLVTVLMIVTSFM